MLIGVLVLIQCLSLVGVQGSFCLFRRSPGQIRVALRGPNGITISWRTTGTFGFNDTPKPQVKYWTSETANSPTLSSIGTSRNYNLLSFFHDVPLLNLSPSTKYYYRIVESSVGCVRESDQHSFVTPPVVGSSQPVQMTYVADLGNDNLLNGGGSTRTMKALREIAPSTSFFIHPGDISYADDYGVLLPFEFYEEAWNKWQDNMEEITSNNIYMTGPGNHEVTCFQLSDAICPDNYKNFSAYLHRFRMPGEESGGFKNLWYSFDYGMVHVIFINTETDFPNAPAGPGTTLNGGHFKGLTEQLRWLKNDLEQAVANRNQVPWIIVTGHRPFYSSNPQFPAFSDNCVACRDAFQSLFFQYNVDFYLSAHIHWYERLFPTDQSGNPVSNDYNNPSGPIYIVNGAGGAPEGAAQVKSAISASAKIVTGFGYSRLEFQDSSNVRLSFYSSDKLAELDSVQIIRHH